MSFPPVIFVLTSFEGLALLLTLFRLTFRIRIGRFWWEDAWALVAFVCGLITIITLYIPENVDNETILAASAWLYMYTWPGVIWSVRMSLLTSIARVVHPGRLRMLILVSGWLFVVMYLGLAAQKTYLCMSLYKNFRERGDLAAPACLPNHTTAICEVTADVVSDAITVVLPLRVLWTTRLQTRQRRMIMAIFSSSAAVTVICILHSVAEIAASTSPYQAIATLVEIAVSLIVCNLLVIVTLIYRRVIKEPTCIPENPSITTVIDGDDGDDDFTRPVPSARSGSESGFWTRVLTTIELTFSSGSLSESIVSGSSIKSE